MTSCVDHGKKGNSRGYTSRAIKVNGKWFTTTAHRVVFFTIHGYWPQVVRHTCDNPRCINPEHLVGGTQKDNRADCVSRGRTGGCGRPRIRPEVVAAVLQSSGRQAEIAAEFNISKCSVSNIQRGLYNGFKV